MTRPKPRADLLATKLAQRNALIIERIKAGEKRYVVALDFNLSPKRVSEIGQDGFLPAWSRFGRKANN